MSAAVSTCDMDRPLDHYRVEIWWSARDNACLARMPELPGCMADGDTQERALHNLHEVARLWIEAARALRREVPRPADTPVAA